MGPEEAGAGEGAVAGSRQEKTAAVAFGRRVHSVPIQWQALLLLFGPSSQQGEAKSLPSWRGTATKQNKSEKHTVG